MMREENECDQQFRMAKIAHPSADRPVTVFDDWAKAVENIDKHLLTSPECEAWQVVRPDLQEDLSNVDRRHELLVAAQESRGAAVQFLYDRYAAAIRDNVQDSALLQWRVASEEWALTIGTDGVLTVFNPYVRAAFLPGHGVPEGRTESPAVLARHQGMRSGRGSDARKSRKAPESKRAKWSRTEKLYYDVFKPAVQFVRRCHPPAYSSMKHSNELTGEYWKLKPVLPRMSQLHYGDWAELRRRCNRPEDEQ